MEPRGWPRLIPPILKANSGDDEPPRIDASSASGEQTLRLQAPAAGLGQLETRGDGG